MAAISSDFQSCAEGAANYSERNALKTEQKLAISRPSQTKERRIEKAGRKIAPSRTLAPRGSDLNLSSGGKAPESTKYC